MRPKRMPDLPQTASLFARAKASWLDAGGPRLRVWQWGDESAPTTLLAHGWNGRGSQMAPFVEPLLARGRHVVTFDSTAHGESEGELSSVADLGRAVERVAKSLPRIDETIGHSLGSAGTLWAFGHGVSVRKSVHIAGPSSLDRMLGYLERAFELSADEAAAARAELEEVMKTSIMSLEPSALAHGFVHPALILHDRADREVPFAESEALAAIWPQPTFVEVKGLGHRRILESPVIIEQIMTFLG